MFAKLKITLLFSLLLPLFLNAEITRFTLSWDPVYCNQPTCKRLLSTWIKEMHQVGQLKFDEKGNKAIIYWKPYTDFNYDVIDNLMHRLGLAPQIENTPTYESKLAGIIKLRGTITHDADFVYIRSIGDNSRFVLIGPTRDQTTRYVEKFSFENRKLDPKIRLMLLEAEEHFRVVTIEGPLFEPERRPPLYIVVKLAEVND